ncbi:hypothetical protein B296_00007075 [Ensete ventricosum]|uniref:Uncharacterized protein n=1 Tax=Ensete ventricosum TaxID=4639 RepID=A0A426ZC71_ENSVE|nr:hypothetical protein B296_00007075 [Ensete ventricosum]
MRNRTSTISQKNMTFINYAQSRARSRVSIGFSCIVSEIQNFFWKVKIMYYV